MTQPARSRYWSRYTTQGVCCLYPGCEEWAEWSVSESGGRFFAFCAIHADQYLQGAIYYSEQDYKFHQSQEGPE